MPLFPELRPYLQAARDELLADFDPKAKRLSEQPVITRYRDTQQQPADATEPRSSKRPA